MQNYINKIKECLKAQLFYLQTAASGFKEAFKFCAAVLLLAFVSICAPFAHGRYIEKHVGPNSLFLRSPEGAVLQGSGTGFEVKAPSGKVYTITNAHVCGLQKDGLLLAGEKRNSHRLIPIRVLEVYAKNDLCILEGLAGYEGLTVADDIEVGQFAWAVGYPMGQAMDITSGRIKSFGTILVLDDETPIDKCNKPGMHVEKLNFIFVEIPICVLERNAAQTDLRIFPGNSGSPLVNIYGNVIGVVFAADNRTNWGSAVPLSDLKEFLSAY